MNAVAPFPTESVDLHIPLYSLRAYRQMFYGDDSYSYRPIARLVWLCGPNRVSNGAVSDVRPDLLLNKQDLAGSLFCHDGNLLAKPLRSL